MTLGARVKTYRPDGATASDTSADRYAQLRPCARSTIDHANECVRIAIHQHLLPARLARHVLQLWTLTADVPTIAWGLSAESILCVGWITPHRFAICDHAVGCHGSHSTTLCTARSGGELDRAGHKKTALVQVALHEDWGIHPVYRIPVDGSSSGITISDLRLSDACRATCICSISRS